MTIAEWLIVFAVFAGPIVAVRITRHLDDKKEIKDRKLRVFKTLMGTRAHTMSWSHVEALNLIDIEFDERDEKEKTVLIAWKEYLDLLNNTSIPIDHWGVKRIDLLLELLYKMAQVLDYDFDKTHIKNSFYSPREHTDIEDTQKILRQGLKELMEGRRSVPIHLTNIEQKSNQ